MNISSRLGLVATLFIYIASLTAGADVPAGYYDRAAGLTTERLKTALHEIINPHRTVSSYSALPTYFERTDVYPDSKRWWDMYSDIPLYAPSFKGLNREHSFPKSWWGGSTSIPVYVDLFHLYPSEAAANQAKSNYPLGIVTGTPSFDNGVSLVGRGIESGGASKVFEPADEYKGDFARTYFYVVTCYQDLKWKWNYMVTDGDYPTLQPWAIELLLAWHRADPVSEKEKNRNEVVYSIQTNRNPFIDYPELAEYIWGDRMGETFVPGDTPAPGGNPELSAPAPDAAIEFGRVAADHSLTRHELFKGHDLSGYLEMSVIGADRDAFTLEQSYLSAEAVNSPSGVYLAITFKPKRLGKHEAGLVIQDGGLDGSITLPLRGECVEGPNLVTPVALPAEMRDKRNYTALWNQPEGGSPVDYWTVYVTAYRADHTTVTKTYLAEETRLDIEADSLSERETYYVVAEALGCQSAPSNTITVDTSGIEGVTMDEEPLEVIVDGLEGYIRCGAPHSRLRVIDSLGRTVTTLRRAANGTEISFPSPGIYLIVSDSRRTPVRVVVR